MFRPKKFILERFNSTRLGARTVCLFLRLYSFLYRNEIENEEPWRRYVEDGGRVILGVWHQQFFAGIWEFRRLADMYPAIMISRSRDGDIVAGVGELTGWFVARGSSSSGGGTALAKMIDHVGRHGLGVHIVDGPRGPAGRIKRGLVKLAHGTEAAVVPLYITADRCWHLRSWDRFMIPKPGARVTMRFGDPIHLDTSEDKDAIERQRLAIETVMRREGWEEQFDGATQSK